ncbi:hypothetical protein [Haloarchaeobius sp. DFWS5]|uniref:hypothetical protein n=1 Tax=Haloarchaeobius sp. DFWS5 TaxID=3446114 RepID=UPI003EC0DA10
MHPPESRVVVDELLGAFDATDERRKRVDVALQPLGDGAQVTRTFTAVGDDGGRYTRTQAAAVAQSVTLEGAKLDVQTGNEDDQQDSRIGFVPALRRLPDDQPVVADAVSFEWAGDRFVREEVSLPERREEPRSFWHAWYDDDEESPVQRALAPAVRSVGERLFRVTTARSTSDSDVAVEDNDDELRVTAPRPQGRSLSCEASVRHGELFLTVFAEQRRYDVTASATTPEPADEPDSHTETPDFHTDDVSLAVAPPYPITAVDATATVAPDRVVVRVPRCSPDERRDGPVTVRQAERI